MTLVLKPRDSPSATLPTTETRRQRFRLPESLVRHQRAIDATVVTTIVLIVGAVHGFNVTGYPSVGDDEGTYLAQAWAIQQGQGLAHYVYWYDHPPFGWIQIAALSWVPAWLAPDHLAVANARIIMIPVTGLAVALMYLFGRRLSFTRWAAALASLLFALSPLAITLQRQIYLDNFAVVWILGAFVLALSPTRHLWHHIAAGLCAALAILSKETMLVVLPALVIALCQGTDRTTRKFSMVGFFAAFALVGFVYPLYAALRNELFPGEGHVSLIGAIMFQLGREGSESFLTGGSGSRQVVESWLFYDSVVIVGGLAAAAIGLMIRRLRAPAVAVLVLLLVALRPGYLPAMYVIQALPFLALCLAGVLDAAASFVSRHRAYLAGPTRWTRWMGAVVVLTVAIGLAGYTTARWYAGVRTALTADTNVAYRETVAFLATLPHSDRTRVLVDDALWLDLVREGYGPGRGAIWFYKLDLDPEVRLPNGARDLDYVVSTPIVRQATKGLPTVTAALTDSIVVKTFGSGDARVEARRLGGSAP